MPHIQIQFRRDTSVSWTFANPVLASGEMGIELDTKQFKIGDGTTRWSLLPYGGIQGPVGPAGLILPPTTPQIGQVLTYVGGPPSGIQWRNQLSYNTTTATIRGSKAATNFDFTNATWPAIIPAAFGSGFTSGTDTDTFSITMNSSYTMQNLPIITGTVAYWDDSSKKMFYMQMKFGNSSTSNSIAMSIEPTSPYNLSTNYGTPLRLTISGITANAFTGVGNIGASPLNYAIVIYLQLNN
jgi:hypothetical protein